MRRRRRWRWWMRWRGEVVRAEVDESINPLHKESSKETSCVVELRL